MSKENAMKFFKKAEAEPELREKLTTLEREHLEQVAALAREVGCIIMPEDFAEEVRSLSDVEMDDVAGGDSSFEEGYRRQQEVLARIKKH